MPQVDLKEERDVLCNELEEPTRPKPVCWTQAVDIFIDTHKYISMYITYKDICIGVYI